MVADQSVVVVQGHGTNVHGSIRSFHRLDAMPTPFQGFIHSLQEDALLRIHRICLIRAKVEERCVEQAHIFFQQVRAEDVARTMMGSIRVVERFGVKSIRPNVDTYISWSLEEFPESRRRIGTAWEPAGAANDGNWLLLLWNHFIQQRVNAKYGIRQENGEQTDGMQTLDRDRCT
jgi:hypothetical protein